MTTWLRPTVTTCGKRNKNVPYPSGVSVSGENAAEFPAGRRLPNEGRAARLAASPFSARARRASDAGRAGTLRKASAARRERTGFVEDTWLGRQLAVGDTFVFGGFEPTLWCVTSTLAQEDLPRDLSEHESFIGGRDDVGVVAGG